MKTAVYYNNNDIRIEEREKPPISEGELLVKVMASGICGTDIMEWYRIKKAPRVLGHEIAGIVEESKSDKFKPGERVFVSHHVPCNRCRYCMSGNHTACETLHNGNYDPGGFSEFIRIPRINVENGTYPLGPLSYEEGAMIEPLACCVRGQNLVGIKEGHTVLVLGSGVSGLMNIQLAKLKGAKVIATDINGYRLKKAIEFGADEAIDVSKSGSDGKLNIKAERIIICTGAMKAVGQAFSCIDKKGTILFFAIPSEDFKVPSVDLWRNELTLTSSYGAAPQDLKDSLGLIKEKKIDVKSMITNRLPLDRIQDGFNIASQAKDSLKVVIEPNAR
ncbi:alcohol dehydrogenase catalytic domain-containing protein [Candidatus Woesearchaeota archaeon]|nr:alcohol dehydrogenase catalytic domain-containing protein [Candidatus Woesearchaeota archaeon]